MGVRVVVGLLLLVAASAPVQAGQVPVRFPEGIIHGFLVLRTLDGKQVAQGEQRQVVVDGTVKVRMSFDFADGSSFDETVVYTQQRFFAVQTYRLVMRGPTFPEDSDVSFDRASGQYRVKTNDRKGKPDKSLEGKLDFPNDVYNGMIFCVTKNLPDGAGEKVHYVAFTPEPRIIELEIVPSGQHKVLVGALEKSSIHYVLKPDLGTLLNFFATITGKMPPDNHVWVFKDDVPAFVRFQGPLFRKGPTWTIELTSPRWPE